MPHTIAGDSFASATATHSIHCSIVATSIHCAIVAKYNRTPDTAPAPWPKPTKMERLNLAHNLNRERPWPKVKRGASAQHSAKSLAIGASWVSQQLMGASRSTQTKTVLFAEPKRLGPESQRERIIQGAQGIPKPEAKRYASNPSKCRKPWNIT